MFEDEARTAAVEALRLAAVKLEEARKLAPLARFTQSQQMDIEEAQASIAYTLAEVRT